LCDIFRGIATCKVGDGSTVLFWSDVWNDHLLQNKYPRLYSFAKNKQITVAQFLLNNQIESQFHLPLSVQAFQEYQDLQQLIQQLQMEPENKTVGSISGATIISLQADSIIFLSKISTLIILFRSGTQSVQTK
jgi:hypothetical protein